MQEKSHNESQLFSRLEKLRLVKQLSWDELADLLEVNRSYFFHVKAGRKSFSRKVLFRLEAAERAAGLLPPESPSPESPSSVKTPSDGFQDAEKLDRAELRKAIALIEKGLEHLKRALGEK